MYSVSIPTPKDIYDYKQVALITTLKNEFILVYWRSVQDQVMILYDKHGWFIQPNGRIIEALGALMCRPDIDIKFDNLFFTKNGFIEPANELQAWTMYDDTWSTYATKDICLNCSISLRLKNPPPGLPPRASQYTLEPIKTEKPSLPNLFTQLLNLFPYSLHDDEEILSESDLVAVHHADLVRSWT